MTLALRRWACHLVEHHRPIVIAASLAGMAGFVVSTGPARWAGKSEATVLLGSLASLWAYGFALGVGHLGDRWELAKLELSPRAAAAIRRPRAGARSRRRHASLQRAATRSTSWT